MSAVDVARDVVVGWGLILGMVAYTLAVGARNAGRRLRGRSP